MRYATKLQVVIRRVNILQSCRMLSFALEKGKRSDSGGTRDRTTHSKVDCQKGATSAIDKLRWLRYVSCYMQQKYQEGPKPKTFGAVRPPSLPPPIPQKQPITSSPTSTSTPTIQDSNPHHIEPLTSALHHRRATKPSFTMVLHPEKKKGTFLNCLRSVSIPTSAPPPKPQRSTPPLHTETYIRPVRPSFPERCAIKSRSLDWNPQFSLVRDPAFPLLISGGSREKKSMGLLAYSGGVFRIGGLAWREGKTQR
jgi:hypothetical protein